VTVSSLQPLDVFLPTLLALLGHEARIGERRYAYRVLVGKPEGKIPLGRHRRRWEDNIKMDVGSAMRGMDWTDLARNINRWRALFKAVTNLRVL
jgi:hypothetical protein